MTAVDPAVAGSTTAPDVSGLVIALVNTRAIVAANPYAREDLGTPVELDRWWARSVDTSSWAAPAGAADLDAALSVREGLRALLARHNDAVLPEDAESIARFDEVAARLPVRLSAAGPTGPRLVPLDVASPAAAMGDLLGRVAVLTGDLRSWSRLKVCRDPHCREAFLDATRSRTRTWCSMDVCGLRAKQRTFAERRRALAVTAGPVEANGHSPRFPREFIVTS